MSGIKTTPSNTIRTVKPAESQATQAPATTKNPFVGNNAATQGLLSGDGLEGVPTAQGFNKVPTTTEAGSLRIVRAEETEKKTTPNLTLPGKVLAAAAGTIKDGLADLLNPNNNNPITALYGIPRRSDFKVAVANGLHGIAQGCVAQQKAGTTVSDEQRLSALTTFLLPLCGDPENAQAYARLFLPALKEMETLTGESVEIKGNKQDDSALYSSILEKHLGVGANAERFDDIYQTAKNMPERLEDSRQHFAKLAAQGSRGPAVPNESGNRSIFREMEDLPAELLAQTYSSMGFTHLTGGMPPELKGGMTEAAFLKVAGDAERDFYLQAKHYEAAKTGDEILALSPHVAVIKMVSTVFTLGDAYQKLQHIQSAASVNSALTEDAIAAKAEHNAMAGEAALSLVLDGLAAVPVAGTAAKAVIVLSRKAAQQAVKQAARAAKLARSAAGAAKAAKGAVVGAVDTMADGLAQGGLRPAYAEVGVGGGRASGAEARMSSGAASPTAGPQMSAMTGGAEGSGGYSLEVSSGFVKQGEPVGGFTKMNFTTKLEKGEEIRISRPTKAEKVRKGSSLDGISRSHDVQLSYEFKSGRTLSIKAKIDVEYKFVNGKYELQPHIEFEGIDVRMLRDQLPGDIEAQKAVMKELADAAEIHAHEAAEIAKREMQAQLPSSQELSNGTKTVETGLTRIEGDNLVTYVRTSGGDMSRVKAAVPPDASIGAVRVPFQTMFRTPGGVELPVTMHVSIVNPNNTQAGLSGLKSSVQAVEANVEIPPATITAIKEKVDQFKMLMPNRFP